MKRWSGIPTGLAVALMGVLIATVMMGTQLAFLPADHDAGLPIARTLTQTDSDPRERLLIRGDGQFYAALATDPSMARPGVLREPPQGYAYRWVRPLFSWLAWAGSLGRPAAVPSTLLALTVLSAGVLVFGAAMLARTLRRTPSWALATLALPGSVVILEWTGPELLATGLALAATSLIVRERRPTVSAVILLTLSVLSRETLLLVCLGLATWLWMQRGRRIHVADLAVVGMPGAVLGGWFGIVWWRTGLLPLATSGDRVSVPLRGILESAPSWTPQTITMVGIMTCVVVLGIARAGKHRGAVVVIAAPTLIFALTLGTLVWGRWEDIGRIVLPACAVLLVAALPAAHRVAAVGEPDSV